MPPAGGGSCGALPRSPGFCGASGPKPFRACPDYVRFWGGASGPEPRGTFCPCKKYPKTRQPAAGALCNVLMRTRRQGLVLSTEIASCGAGSQKRLPLRRALWAYRSLGLEALRLIHMKCGCDTHAAPSLPLQFLWKENRWLYPINRASAEAGPETRLRSDARRICYSVAGCYQDTTQSDETKGSLNRRFKRSFGYFSID